VRILKPLAFMKHQNIIDKNRNYNSTKFATKAGKSKSQFRQQQHELQAHASESLPAVESTAAEPEALTLMEKAKDGIQKFASGVSKNVTKGVTTKNLKSAGGIASAVAIAGAVAIVAGKKLAKNTAAKQAGRKFAKNVIAVEEKAVREVKKQAKQVKKFFASPSVKKVEAKLKSGVSTKSVKSVKTKVAAAKRKVTRTVKAKVKAKNGKSRQA
jgi:hypothetical protein